MQGQVWSQVHRGDKRAIETSRKIAKQRLQVLGHDGLMTPKRKIETPVVEKPIKVSEFDNPEPFHLL